MSSDKFIVVDETTKITPAHQWMHKHGRMHSLLEERVLCYPFNHSTTNRRPPFSLSSFLCRPEITSFQRFINREGNRSMDKLFANVVGAKICDGQTKSQKKGGKNIANCVWIIVSSGVKIRLDVYGEISWLTVVGKSK